MFKNAEKACDNYEKANKMTISYSLRRKEVYDYVLQNESLENRE